MMLQKLRRVMQRRRGWILVALACLVLGASGIVRAAAVLDAFAQAVDRTHDYTVMIAVHETNGRKTQDRMLRYSYEKPNLIKAEIVGGPGSGGAAVWHGGDSVRGHQGGLLRFITLNVNVHDARATSLRGDTIDSAAFATILEHLRAAKGKLDEAQGPMIEGQATDALTLEAQPIPRRIGTSRARCSIFPGRRIFRSSESCSRETLW